MWVNIKTNTVSELPKRIRLDDGSTRTSLEDLSEEVLLEYGYANYTFIETSWLHDEEVEGEIVQVGDHDPGRKIFSGNYIIDNENKTVSEEIIDIDLSVIKKNKIAQIEAEAEAERACGFTSSIGITVKVEPYDLTRWTQLMVQMMAFPAANQTIFDFNNQIQTLSTQDATTLLMEISANEKQIAYKTWAATQAVEAAETAEDILAVTR